MTDDVPVAPGGDAAPEQPRRARGGAVRAAAAPAAAAAIAVGAAAAKTQKEERAEGELVDKLVAINRVAKVVKGGKNFAFAALVVVGDKKGRAGFGHGKAREVPEAIRKATEEAKKSLIRVPLREGRTLHHDGHGHWGAGHVMLRAAPPGNGHHRRRADARRA